MQEEYIPTKNQNKNNPQKHHQSKRKNFLISGILQEGTSRNRCFEVIFNLETSIQNLEIQSHLKRLGFIT